LLADRSNPFIPPEPAPSRLADRVNVAGLLLGYGVLLVVVLATAFGA
jgi:hypothetical protein